MFRQSFDERLFESLSDVEDPSDVVTIVDKTGDILSAVAAVCDGVEGIDNCWDELVITFLDEERAKVEARIHIEYKVWTETIRSVMFTLLRDGFMWSVEQNAFEYEMEIP